jgi:hypothetical protein
MFLPLDERESNSPGTATKNTITTQEGTVPVAKRATPKSCRKPDVYGRACGKCQVCKARQREYEAEFNVALMQGRIAPGGHIIPRDIRLRSLMQVNAAFASLHAYGCMCLDCQAMQAEAPEEYRELHRSAAELRRACQQAPFSQLTSICGKAREMAAARGL